MAKAPVGKRVIAYIIDAVLLGVVIGLVYAAIFVLMFGLAFVSDTLAGLSMLLMFPAMLLVMALMLGYWLFRDGLNGGRSYGKKFMGLKVVKDGAPATFKDSLLRNITLVVPLLNLVDLILGLVDADGKRIGDKIANTQVVEA